MTPKARTQMLVKIYRDAGYEPWAPMENPYATRSGRVPAGTWAFAVWDPRAGAGKRFLGTVYVLPDKHVQFSTRDASDEAELAAVIERG